MPVELNPRKRNGAEVWGDSMTTPRTQSAHRKPKVEAEDIDGSEAAMAAYLAEKTDLNQTLQYAMVGGSLVPYEWTGNHWERSPDKLPLSLQIAVRRAIANALEQGTIEAREVNRLESASGIRGIGTLLAAFPEMKLAAEIDPPNFIACPRGVLDLLSGEWLEHDPSRPITKVCPVDPGESCPLWLLIEDHMKVCLGALYPAVQRLLGSALLGLGADRRFLWLYGPGGDGKSATINAIRAATGQHAVIVPAEVFGDGGNRGAHLHELGAAMSGARVAVGLEVSTRLDWSKLKGLTGGDAQRTKNLHGRAFTYERPPVLVLVSNDRPSPPDAASAQRLVVAELRPPDDADERIAETLKTPGPERDRIASACLAWLIEGCQAFQINGLGPVPMFSHQPSGLAAWWDDAVRAGRIVPGGNWTPLAAIREDLDDYARRDSWVPPRDNELSAFLQSIVEKRRFNDGRRYCLDIKKGKS